MKIGSIAIPAIIVTAGIVYVTAVYPAQPAVALDERGSSVGLDTCKAYAAQPLKDRYATYLAGFSDAQSNPARRPSADIAREAVRAVDDYCATHDKATVVEAIKAHFNGAPTT